jgi:hypothetical protein
MQASWSTPWAWIRTSRVLRLPKEAVHVPESGVTFYVHTDDPKPTLAKIEWLGG